MPRCKICDHPERVKIESLRAGGASLVSLAERFELGPGGKDAIWRHWTKCVSKERKGQLLVGETRLAELVEMANAEDRSLLEYLSLIRSILVNQLATAAECGDRHGTAFLSARLLECLEKIGKLTGEIRQLAGTSITNNLLVMSSPLVADLQSTLIRTLAPYPEARDAVIVALRDLESRNHPPSLPAKAPQTIEAVADA